MLVTCLHLGARGLGQGKITITAKAASLESILKDIRKQTGYQYLFVDQWEQEARRIDISVKNASLEEVLGICFRDQPFSYTIIKKMIVIKKKEEEAKAVSEGLAAPINFKGRVTNEQGEPLVGASVSLKNGKKGTLTDEKGLFTLSNIPADAVLVVSYTGYQGKEVPVNGEPMLTIILGIANSILDQVKVIAYGTTSQRLATGNATTISAKEIGEQPVNNPLLALEGRVPGMFITQNAGTAGGAVSALVQGQNSISFGTYPYYVIDGVPYTSTLLQSVPANPLGNDHGNHSIASFGSPLSFINPADIESISILKDADATAIYGSRAANGAIIITTKKGKIGNTKININANSGWGKITRSLNLLNTPQYLQMRHEALNNDGLSPNLDNGDYDLLLWDTTRNTNWINTLIGQTSHYNDIQASVSGGNSNLQILVDAGFHRETSVFPKDFADQKESIHFNLANTSNNQKFKIQLTGNYLLDNNQLPANDPTNTAILLPPDAPKIYKADGTLNWEPSASGNTTWPGNGNPFAYFNYTYSNKTNNLVSNAVLSYTIIHGLDIKSNFGYTNMQSVETNTIPSTTLDPAQLPFVGDFSRAAYYGNSNIHSWVVEPQISYNNAVGKGKLNVLCGGTINQIVGNGQVILGSGYNSDLQLGSVLAASSVSVQSATNSVYKYEAVFGRINYNWADKYLINLTMRRDGSSRFGPANQFHNFGAIGAAWLFSKEGFIHNLIPPLSFGKIRFSYGTTGSDQIGDYRYMDLYRLPFGISAPYQGVTGNQVNNLFNPNLSWEETKKFEVGIELGLLDDKVLAQVTYFQNHSSDELLGAGLPFVTGFASVYENLPALVENKGWELTLNTRNITSKNFSWSTSFNLTIARNTLKSFNSNKNTYYPQFVGHSVSSIMLYHFLGVNDTTGIYQFAGKSGPTSTPDATDATVFKNLDPDYYGGLINTIKYKTLQLDFIFQFVKQLGPNYLFGQYPGSPFANQPTTVLRRWQTPGTVTNIQRYNSDYSLYQQVDDAYLSDGGYTDASYIRLKNISLSYQFQEQAIKKLHLQNLRMYILGQNILTLTDYHGMDPENKSVFNLSPLKIYTIGLEVTF